MCLFYIKFCTFWQSCNYLQQIITSSYTGQTSIFWLEKGFSFHIFMITYFKVRYVFKIVAVLTIKLLEQKTLQFKKKKKRFWQAKNELTFWKFSMGLINPTEIGYYWKIIDLKFMFVRFSFVWWLFTQLAVCILKMRTFKY